MVYCPKCGFKNEDDAEFCVKCGAPLTTLQTERGSRPEKKGFEGS